MSVDDCQNLIDFYISSNMFDTDILNVLIYNLIYKHI